MILLHNPESSILEGMKLVINLKLNPDAAQQRALLDTLERCNEACNWLSAQAFEFGVFGKFALQKTHYYSMREKFNLTAQVAIRCISKVADAYKLKNKCDKLREFRKWSAQPYDDRIFRFAKGDSVNLWTLNGRQTIPFSCGRKQRNLIPFRKGEVDLMFIKGKWYVSCVVDIDEADPIAPKGILGIDLGIVNIAADSTGEVHSGNHVEVVRSRYAVKRAMLQKTGSRRAKRRLKALSGKQARFQKITNHTISKAIVSKAKRLSLSISVEDLTNIRDGIKARKANRDKLHNWSFYDLKAKIEYKAKRFGIPFVAINPRNTSRQCSECGHIAKANRKTQALFKCQDCGYESNADQNAAVNIAARGSEYVTSLYKFAHQCTLGVVESPGFSRGDQLHRG